MWYMAWRTRDAARAASPSIGPRGARAGAGMLCSVAYKLPATVGDSVSCAEFGTWSSAPAVDVGLLPCPQAKMTVRHRPPLPLNPLLMDTALQLRNQVHAFAVPYLVVLRKNTHDP